MDIYKGKVVVITGAASGLGRGLSVALARRGAHVVATDIDEAGLEQTLAQASGHVEVQTLDVARPGAVEALLKEVAGRHGQLDYVFNNAGFAIIGEVSDIPMPAWRKIVDVNLLGVVQGSLAAYAIMRRQGHGHIVNTASLAGLLGYPTMTAYAMTKAAVVSFSKDLRLEAEAAGVKVTVLCPSFIESHIYEHARIAKIARGSVRKLVPFKLMATEAAVAEILRRVARNQGVAVFPGHARLLWWLARFWPGSLTLFARKALRDFRAAKTSN